MGLALCCSLAHAAERGPTVLDSPLGAVCRTWIENGATYLEVVNETDRMVAGTVELNEIYEKVLIVQGGRSAEIDGRWIEIELPARATLRVRLGK